MLLPGLGQLVAGRRRRGIVMLMITVALLAVAASAASRDIDRLLVGA